MKVIVVGYGIQGRKRKASAGTACVAVVDPVSAEATHKSLQDVPLDHYDAALVCTPDGPKPELLAHLLHNGKHVLVEKPLLTDDDAVLQELQTLAEKNRAVCYTAYNHRFEPHFIRMKELLTSEALGRAYSLRMFYGNGTARLVRDSVWRDSGAGVLPDLGSHLLDTLLFWFPRAMEWDYRLRFAYAHENRCFDQVGIEVTAGPAGPAVQLEMTLLMWRNHFTADIMAEGGSAHIESLCKWGPSTFTHRRRILPSGRPPESSVTLVQDDPTWQAEYAHFVELCRTTRQGNIATDRWLNKVLGALAAAAKVPLIPRGIHRG